MKKFVVTALFLFCLLPLRAQIHFNGHIKNALDNKPIENVALHFVLADTTIFTDTAGYFSVQLPAMEYPKLYHIAFDIEHAVYKELPVMNFEFERQQEILLQPKTNIFNIVTITASRALQNDPVTFTNIKGSALNANNFGEDMPFLLESTPSAVVTSDAGNGVGYTGIRIRGSDATRVNITVNGVPYNDAESQQTYWVDLPDFAASVDDIQIQRGVGLSTNGISAFGAAININTNNLSTTPFVKTSLAFGSFNLSKKSIALGTGLINNHWTLEGRYTDIYADGFIDRSFADLQSYFITAAYTGKKYTSVVNVFSGIEHTYQSWGGVPAEIIDTNRTYNPYTYANQTDNYIQTHYQWHNHFYFPNKNTLHITVNYTHGSGYYEQLEEAQYFADYGALNPVINNDTIFTTDLITQKWLDSDFGGFFVQYEKQLPTSKLNIGGAYYLHDGLHFGNIIWSEIATTIPVDYQWYLNKALKQDGNIFAQYTYSTSKFIVLADAQLRNVNYRFEGLDATATPVQQQVNLLFFNPKAGITFLHNRNFETYVFLGIANKEPNRDDYVESSPASRPLPEQLFNVEAGERWQYKGWELMANVYLMYYNNQLVLTGEINDVGAYTRTNIPKSYRSGVEIAWAKTFFSKLSWEANATFSKNAIIAYTEFIDNWDTGEQTPVYFENTQIAFSPSVIAFNKLNFNLLNTTSASGVNHRVYIEMVSKYVGQQYADNTMDSNSMLKAYLVHDAGLQYQFSNAWIPSLSVRVNLQNLTNLDYESNAWVYRYIYENNESRMMGYYPQAGLNWNAGIVLTF